MPNFSQRTPPTSLQRKLRIKHELVRLLAMEQLSHSTLDDTSLEEDCTSMETSSKVLPPNVDDTPWDSAQCGSDVDDDLSDDDSSDDSYISYQPSNEEVVEDDDDNDLAAALSWTPTTDEVDFSEVGEFLLQADCSMMDPPTGTTLNEPEQPEEYPKHDDELQLDTSEMAMLDLLVLCDSSGARRGFYDELLTLLRRHIKKGFVITKAKGRDAFISDMRKKVPTPKPTVTMVEGREIVHFSFLDMLRDLLCSSKFNEVNNLCVNQDENNRFLRFQPTNSEDISETMSKKWATETQDSLEDFDPDKDLFLPLNLYADKTGTDVNQRYPLEPWMFTTPLLRRKTRESADAWRHLGFLPSLDDVGTPDNDEDGPASNDSSDKLQLYHDFLAVLLKEVKDCRDNKPEMMVNLGGIWQRRRLHIHVAAVMGDQKSQDYLCGRKSINSGNAGRVHRSCMASAIQASNVSATINCDGCRLANPNVFRQLNNIALVDISEGSPGPLKTIYDSLPQNSANAKREFKSAVAYIQRQQRLAKAILGGTFSMHPLMNAFDGIPFGANKHGILVATTEDHLHSCESGILLHIAEVAYQILTPAESKEFEQIIRNKVTACKSSALSEYPRGTVKKNFGKLTLCSHKEKVGILYYLLLALHDKSGRTIFENAKTRQQEKYKSFPTKKKMKEWQGVATRGNASKKRKQSGPPTSTTDMFDSDSEEHEESTEDDGDGKLPASAFPYRKDLLFGSDHRERNPFDCTDASIEFVLHHLRLHGFGFLLSEDLDELQLDLLMVSSWRILRPLHGKPDQYPSKPTVDILSMQQRTQILFSPITNDDGDNHLPSFLEMTCSNEGCRYDWVMTLFNSSEEDEVEDEGSLGDATPYPAKVLALYEDSEGTLKALVHSVEEKKGRNVEGPFGDSRLIQHYRLQFHHNGRPKMYSIPVTSIQHVVVAYEAVHHDSPLIPPVSSAATRREYTVMVVLPRNNWAQLFLDWARELKERQETVSGRDKYRLDWRRPG